MRLFFSALCILLCGIASSHAFPRFHQVNKSFYNGTACPAITKRNVPCPALCVTDRTLCPSQISPTTCPYPLCPDGSCSRTCPSSTSVCSCSSRVMPCATTLTVDIPHYDPGQEDVQLVRACNAALNATETNDYQWDKAQCPRSASGTQFPSRAPVFLSYMGIYGAFFVLLALWIPYKRWREKEVVAQDGTRLFKGYSNDYFGSALAIYMACVSVGWMIFLLVISLDYYGYVTGVPYGLFYESYDLSSKAFCVAWFLSTSWYLVINVMRARLRNFLRIRQPVAHASYMQIEQPRHVHAVLSKDETRRMEHVENRIRAWFGLDHTVATVPVQTTPDGTRFVEYRCTRYVYDGHAFERYTPQDEKKTMDEGLTTEEAARRLALLGPNLIQVHVPHFWHAFWQELTGFFYVYQIMILWCYFYLAYWQIGVADTGVILLAALIKVIVRLRSERRIKAMAEHVDTCTVWRDQQDSIISTADLVPGDVLRLEAGRTIAVDALVLTGDVIVDESSLTGEPLPVRKFPARPGEGISSKNRLFAGTTIKQTDNATARVEATRTDTDKGQLVQKILYPAQVAFVFHRQLRIVFAILLCWALFLLGIGSWWLGGTGMTAWFYGTVCAAQVMNPLLPAILVVGQSVAGGRLKKMGIYCVDLPRILMAGKVSVFCFDKTGTLTKEGLEYFGACPIQNDNSVGPLKPTFHDLQTTQKNEPLLRMGMATCHAVTTLNGDFIGNPVDIVMYKATGCQFDQDTVDLDGTPLRVVQRFEFQHARASMSVAVQDPEGHVHVFCKGSFERFTQDPTATNLAQQGCYVLAMAHRDLGPIDDIDQLRTWTRDELEADVQCVGLLVFKNLLKDDTTAAIAELQDQGNTRAVMITGDNVLTGIAIAQACGLAANEPMLLGQTHDEKGLVTWTDMSTGQPVEDEALVRLKRPATEVAMTGAAFRTLLATDPERLRALLFSVRVFGRMTPEDKMACVELFMERAMTAMCGDGGNDCGALRAAHVGIALSEAEASVVSPFSTGRRSIQACVDLIREGRAALATSFASYKYLIMYGETMATVKFCTFYYTLSFSQWNFILVDAFITVFCAFAVTRAKAAPRLSNRRPTAKILGPEVLASVLGQLLINALFLAGAFVWLYTRDDFFRCREWDARATDASKWWLLGDSFEADILTFVSLFQFVNAALIFNYGSAFRQAWYRNYLLLFLWALFVAIVSYWELADPNRFGCLVRLNCGNPQALQELGYPAPSFYIEPYNNPWGHNVLPRTFRYQLWAYSVVNMIVTHAWELLVVLGPVRAWLRRRKEIIPRPL